MRSANFIDEKKAMISMIEVEPAKGKDEMLQSRQEEKALMSKT